MTTIAIIDYGMGNLRSVAKALEHVAPDMQILVSSSTAEIQQADKVVFPGVGGIAHCMDELQHRGLAEVITEVAAEKPFLGICVGMQALFENSEENDGTEGLAILHGSVPKFPAKSMGDLSIPHMGWNNVEQTAEHPLWHNIEDDARFYFVHSFFVEPASQHLNAGVCNYGIDFSAAIYSNNIFATQFHPEKSQHDGLELLKNFSTWDGTC